MSRTKTTKKTAGIKLPAVSIPTERKKGFPIPYSEIEILKQFSREKLVFSLKFFDRDHEAFNLGNTKESWFIGLLDALKEVSGITRNQLVVELRQHYEAHGHDWSKLNYKYSFNDEFLEQVECLQFSLAKSKGRVHGFIIGNRFYIVWLDPHHNLYPDEKHGGRKIFDKAMNCYECLEIEHEKLKRDYAELMEHLVLGTETPGLKEIE